MWKSLLLAVAVATAPAGATDSPSANCVDRTLRSGAKWANKYRYDCAAVEKHSLCSAYGDSAAVEGMTASDACCICGGGRDAPPSSAPATTPPQTPVPDVGPLTPVPETDSPSANCVDRTLRSGAKWANKYRYDCAAVEKHSLCSAYGDSAAVEGMTASDACCICGGGRDAPPSSAPATTPPQTPVPDVGPLTPVPETDSPSANCVDRTLRSGAKWANKYRYDCAAVEKHSLCSAYGDSAAVEGMTASDACCICGGGRDAPPSSAPATTPPQTPVPDVGPLTPVPETASPRGTPPYRVTATPRTPVPDVGPLTPVPETDSPSANCVDRTLRSGAKWANKYRYDCAAVEKHSLCSAYGDSAAVEGMTASDACCICGGGRDAPPSSAPATTPPQTPVPDVGPLTPVPETDSPSANCVDRTLRSGAKWANKYRYDCAAVEKHSLCSAYGDSAAVEGMTASDACCICGGGRDAPPSSAPATTPPQTPVPDVGPLTPVPETDSPSANCVDRTLRSGAKWANKYRYDCAAVEKHSLCSAYGDSAAVEGMTASDACCICGGGRDAPPSSAPATTPPQTPVPDVGPLTPVPETDSPSANCVDRTLRSGAKWANKYRYDCAAVEKHSLCSAYGDSAAVEGMTASDACCICGGGRDAPPSSAPATTPPQTPVPDVGPLTPVPETDSPSANCVDRTLRSGAKWANKYRYDCAAVEKHSLCSAYGDSAAVEGMTASDACCICGGGRDAPPSSAPATTPPQTPVPDVGPLTPVPETDSPSANCVDRTLRSGAKWANKYRYDCAAVEKHSLCSAYGDSAAVEGMTASDACCICGGGRDAPPSSAPATTPPQTPVPDVGPLTPVPETDSPSANCVDRTLRSGAKWANKYRYDCAAVEKHSLCSAYGDSAAVEGMTASDACCICGGGRDAPPSSAPATTPPQTPVPDVGPLTPVPETDSPSANCVDRTLRSGAKWANKYRYDCAAVEKHSLCSAYGDSAAVEGMTASDACCICGGGRGGGDAGASPLTPVPATDTPTRSCQWTRDAPKPLTAEQTKDCCSSGGPLCPTPRDVAVEACLSGSSNATECCHTFNIGCAAEKYDCTGHAATWSAQRATWCCRWFDKGCTAQCTKDNCCAARGICKSGEAEAEPKPVPETVEGAAAFRVKMEGPAFLVMENPKRMLARVRLSLLRGSSKLRGSPEDLVVLRLGALMPGARVPTTKAEELSWAVVVPLAWNVELYGEERATTTVDDAPARAAEALGGGGNGATAADASVVGGLFVDFEVRGTSAPKVGDTVMEAINSHKLADPRGVDYGIVPLAGGAAALPSTHADDEDDEGFPTWALGLLIGLPSLCAVVGLAMFAKRRHDAQNVGIATMAMAFANDSDVEKMMGVELAADNTSPKSFGV